jgi:hypothetical protein
MQIYKYLDMLDLFSNDCAKMQFEDFVSTKKSEIFYFFTQPTGNKLNLRKVNN